MNSATLWLSSERPSSVEGTLILWSQLAHDIRHGVGVISLPELVEQNPEIWRTQYLLWLEAVGRKDHGGQTLLEVMEIRPGFSYWWMTIPSEFSLSPDSIAYAVIRLWLLDEVAKDLELDSLKVIGVNPTLRRVLASWAEARSLRIIFGESGQESAAIGSMSELFMAWRKLVPARAKGLVYLVKLYLAYFTLRRPSLQGGSRTDPIVIDYLAHFDMQAALASRYDSHYWGPLASSPDYLGGRTDWIHIDVRSGTLKSSRKSKAVIRALNKKWGRQHHLLAQSFCDLGVFLRSLLIFDKISQLRKHLKFDWHHPTSGMDFGPIIEGRLVGDLSGTAAANNAFWLCLFEKIFSTAVSNRTLLFLWENQPWELAALHARELTRSATNIGVAHLPVRYWDLRYFLGYTKGPVGGNSLPQPDIVAVPDDTSIDRIGIPELHHKKIVGVEALRFTPNSDRRQEPVPNSPEGNKVRILVVGELLDSMVQNQVRLIERLLQMTGDEYLITFRPHPAGSGGLPIAHPAVRLSTSHLARDDYKSCDAVLCSSISAASLEAHIAGALVMIYRDGGAFNGTPLVPGPGIAWVSGPLDIKKFLDNSHRTNWKEHLTASFPMNFSQNLIRWGRLRSELRENHFQRDSN